MIHLSKQHLEHIDATQVDLPLDAIFNLPERVIQFGTGALLRGLPDDYIHKANQAGIFNGRILVIKSTSQGDSNSFDHQDGLYTLLVQGIENGQIIESKQINASISRVLSAHTHWQEILETAENPMMEILISNTTEAGIVETDGDIHDAPPSSFAAKVTAYLHKRFLHFEGDITKGLVIIPTELISDNAAVLKRIVIQISERHQLGNTFITWVDQANYFCNSLVDRIVPGSIPPETLPYQDKLAIMAEPYRLWAIESDSPVVRDRLSFSEIDPSVKIVPSIEQYKEIKLRMLNATHTLCCGVALMTHIKYVKSFFEEPVLDRYIHHLLFQEISPIIQQSGISEQDTHSFGTAVIDRFKNPFLSHQWQSIALQYTTKMKMRVYPLLRHWYSQHDTPPAGIAIGLAAYLITSREQVIGTVTFQDDYRSTMFTHVQQSNFLHNILSDKQIWGEDTNFPGLNDLVQEIIDYAQQHGLIKAIDYFIPQ